jgi:hypothetical protein
MYLGGDGFVNPCLSPQYLEMDIEGVMDLLKSRL